MKNWVFLFVLAIILASCGSSWNKVATNSSSKPSDTLRIANDELEYEVIIIEPGFNSWLASTARPRGYYSESFLETRNQLYVNEWNSRARQPLRYKSTLYEMEINYDPNIHYGYEVNYLIYNYFIYFQMHYKQQLGTFVPRP